MQQLLQNQFAIRPWSWDSIDGVLTCKYQTTNASFIEEFRFGHGKKADEKLARAFDLLAVTAGVSYFKTSVAETILLPVEPSANWASYVADLYDRGLREFRLQNSLELEWNQHVAYAEIRAALGEQLRTPAGALVPMGGGRDSLLVAHALRSHTPELMVVGNNPIVRIQADQLDLDLHNVDRRIDPLLLDLNRQGAPNGHVPVTAINSCVAVVLAVLLNCADVVLSNERSASSPTRVVNGVDVNHQYSKSWEFEQQLRIIISALELPVNYFSALRGLGEIEISERLGRNWGHLPPFVSCNRGRTLDKAAQHPTWCTRCAKCYFVFLALAPFVTRQALTRYFGRDLLGEPEDADAVERLLLGDSRDFECIGTPAETAFALEAAANGDWNDLGWLQDLARRYQLGPLDSTASGDQPDAVPDSYRLLINAL